MIPSLPALALAALAACALALPAAPRAAEPPVPTLSVSGTGQATVSPDMASVSLGVVATGATAAEALAANSAAMQAVFDLVAAEEIEGRDVQTSQFSLGPIWESPEDGEPRITGYQAYNIVTVRVRDLSRLGSFLDAVTQAGANQINAIAFEVSDSSAALEAARRAAVADALGKARLYAEAAGVTLGRLLALVESGPVMPAPRMAMRAEAVAVPVAEGEATITASVTLTFAIQ